MNEIYYIDRNTLNGTTPHKNEKKGAKMCEYEFGLQPNKQIHKNSSQARLLERTSGWFPQKRKPDDIWSGAQCLGTCIQSQWNTSLNWDKKCDQILGIGFS